MPNIERGFIVCFNCCSDGRSLNINTNGTYNNVDGENVGKASWHPFLIISHTHKNNAIDTRYFVAIPLTSSNSPYNQENGLPLTRDMVSKGGEMLLQNKSIIKIDKIISIHKKDYGRFGYLGEINPSSLPYKQILSKLMKNFGCNEIV